METLVHAISSGRPAAAVTLPIEYCFNKATWHGSTPLVGSSCRQPLTPLGDLSPFVFPAKTPSKRKSMKVSTLQAIDCVWGGGGGGVRSRTSATFIAPRIIEEIESYWPIDLMGFVCEALAM